MTDHAANWDGDYDDVPRGKHRSVSRSDPFRPRPGARLHRANPSHTKEVSPSQSDWSDFVREVMDRDTSRNRTIGSDAPIAIEATSLDSKIDDSIKSEFLDLCVLLFEKHQRMFFYMSMFFAFGAFTFAAYSAVLAIFFSEIAIAKLFAVVIFSIAAGGFFSLWRAIVRG